MQPLRHSHLRRRLSPARSASGRVGLLISDCKSTQGRTILSPLSRIHNESHPNRTIRPEISVFLPDVNRYYGTLQIGVDEDRSRVSRGTIHVGGSSETAENGMT